MSSNLGQKGQLEVNQFRYFYRKYNKKETEYISREMLQHKKDARVVMALPTRTLTLQVGNKPDVARMMGGDRFDESNRLIASTYEKLFEVDDFINAQKGSAKSGEVCLILDECHLLGGLLGMKQYSV